MHTIEDRAIIRAAQKQGRVMERIERTLLDAGFEQGSWQPEEKLGFIIFAPYPIFCCTITVERFDYPGANTRPWIAKYSAALTAAGIEHTVGWPDFLDHPEWQTIEVEIPMPHVQLLAAKSEVLT